MENLTPELTPEEIKQLQKLNKFLQSSVAKKLFGNLKNIEIDKLTNKEKKDLFKEPTSQELKEWEEIKAEARKLVIITEGKQRTLFNNPIDIKKEFGLNRVLADGYRKILDAVLDREGLKRSYQYNGNKFITEDKQGRRLGLGIVGKDIKTEEEFSNAILKIEDPKVLQTFLAFCCYCSDNGSFLFKGVKLAEIMKEVLKTKSGYFTQPQKRAFTETINILRGFEILLDQTTIIKNEKTGKKEKVFDRRYYKLIDLEKTRHSIRNKDLIDEETGEVIIPKGSEDYSVMRELWGELLPRFNKGIMRGRLYNKGINELDANKDGRAVILGFKLLTRFDNQRQCGKKDIYIKLDRKTLIEWAGYTKTDINDKWIANQHLLKTLDKLVDKKIIGRYEPKEITTKDDLQITLYPHPILNKTEAPETKQLKGQNNWGKLPIKQQKEAFRKWLIEKGKSKEEALKIVEKKFRNGFVF
jgi:hypothetical protein